MSRSSGDDPGFDFIASPFAGEELTAIALRRWSQHAARALRETRAASVTIPPYWAGEEGDLRFLRPYAAQLRHVAIGDESIADLSALNDLTALESLAVAGHVETLDFMCFPRLRSCLVSNAVSLGNIGTCPGLTDVGLMGVRLRNLDGLRALQGLRRLHLNDLRSLVSLEGIEGHPIEQIELLYLPRLRSIAPVAVLPRISLVEIVRSKAIADLPELGRARSLETLITATGPELHSVEFLRPLRRLRELWLGSGASEGEGLTLSPLGALTNLRVLQLFDMPLSAIADALSRLHQLSVLVLNRGPELPSFGELRNLRRLRELVLLRTRIHSWDPQSLLELSQLERVRITPIPKAVQGHVEEILRMIRSRRPGEVDAWVGTLRHGDPWSNEPEHPRGAAGGSPTRPRRRKRR